MNAERVRHMQRMKRVKKLVRQQRHKRLAVNFAFRDVVIIEDTVNEPVEIDVNVFANLIR